MCDAKCDCYYIICDSLIARCGLNKEKIVLQNSVRDSYCYDK